MKKIGIVVAIYLFGWSLSVQAASTVELRENRLVLESKGKTTVLSAEDFPVEAVRDATGKPLAGLRYCGVSSDAGKAKGLAPGLYLFDASGKMTAFTPNGDMEVCSEARLSPGKTVLAMDLGASLVHSWLFFAYPGMKPMGKVASYQAENKPGLLWDGETGVYFSSMETEKHKRACGYDPCGPVSVRAYSFKTGKETTLLAGTDRCDFTLTGYEPGRGVVTADKRCLASAKAWKTYPENAPVSNITVKGAFPGQ